MSNRELSFTLCAVLAFASLAGCGSIGKNEEAQAVVNRRAIGMQVGEFFDRYGQARSRAEQLDRSTVYGWESSVGPTPPGPESLDQRICYLRITANRNGRIGEVQVVRDNPGRVSTSRCAEIFRGNEEPVPTTSSDGKRS